MTPQKNERQSRRSTEVILTTIMSSDRCIQVEPYYFMLSIVTILFHVVNCNRSFDILASCLTNLLVLTGVYEVHTSYSHKRPEGNYCGTTIGERMVCALWSSSLITQ